MNILSLATDSIPVVERAILKERVIGSFIVSGVFLLISAIFMIIAKKNKKAGHSKDSNYVNGPLAISIFCAAIFSIIFSAAGMGVLMPPGINSVETVTAIEKHYNITILDDYFIVRDGRTTYALDNETEEIIKVELFVENGQVGFASVKKLDTLEILNELNS